MQIEELKQQVTEKEEQIKSAQERRAQMKGKLDALMDRLKKEFECKTIEEARAKLKKLEVEANKLEDERDAVESEIKKLLEEHDVDVQADTDE